MHYIFNHTFINFPGKPPSSNGCSSWWERSFYLWHYIKVEDKILGKLSRSVSNWKVSHWAAIISSDMCVLKSFVKAYGLIENCVQGSVETIDLYQLLSCFFITGLEWHLKTLVSSWNWYHRWQRSTTWYLGAHGYSFWRVGHEQSDNWRQSCAVLPAMWLVWVMII